MAMGREVPRRCTARRSWVNWDHEGDSFLVALAKQTGREIWRTPREHTTSWSTPIVVEHEGRAQVIASGSQRVCGYDLGDGKLLWECAGLSAENVVASPVAGLRLERDPLLAIEFLHQDDQQIDVCRRCRTARELSRGLAHHESPPLSARGSPS